MKGKYIRLVDDASKQKGHGTVTRLQFDSNTDTKTKAAPLVSEKKTGLIGT